MTVAAVFGRVWLLETDDVWDLGICEAMGRCKPACSRDLRKQGDEGKLVVRWCVAFGMWPCPRGSFRSILGWLDSYLLSEDAYYLVGKFLVALSCQRFRQVAVVTAELE